MLNEQFHSILFEMRKLKHCITPGTFWDVTSVMCQLNKAAHEKCPGLMIWDFFTFSIFFLPHEKYRSNPWGSTQLEGNMYIKDYHNHVESNQL